MAKQRIVELGLVLLVVGGALTYQVIHHKAEKAEIVEQPVPGLAKQQLETVDEQPQPPEPNLEPPSKQSLTDNYIGSLKAPGLRAYNPHLSLLGEAPDWTLLDNYQRTITKSDFLRLLTTVYTIGTDWKEWITVEDDHALITQSAGEKKRQHYRLEFASEPSTKPPRYWRSAKQLGPAPVGKPLQGMVIAIDPGHLGGEQWAELEERDFAIGEDTPIREGEITLKVAMILRPQLEALGADVVLVRSTLEPINPKRPGHYTNDAWVELKGRGEIPSAPRLTELKNRMFYRVGEIRERAKVVNSIIRPDLTLCLHFNANAWGEPGNRKLLRDHHLHLILHGAFTGSEIARDDERFSMIHKILMGNHDEESAVSEEVAATMAKATMLPAYKYEPDSKRARNIKGNEFLWARNLLANRLFDSPVVYLEPYVMNDERDYARIQMGDYEGEKEIDGVQRKSIFREYAHGVTEGLKNYYTKFRGVKNDPAKEQAQETEEGKSDE